MWGARVGGWSEMEISSQAEMNDLGKHLRFTGQRQQGSRVAVLSTICDRHQAHLKSTGSSCARVALCPCTHIRRGQDPCLGSQRPREEIRLALSQPHPIMILMPRALDPALLPMGSTQQNPYSCRAGRVGELCYFQYMVGKHTPMPSPKHGSEELLSLHTSPPRWTTLGSARPVCTLRVRTWVHIPLPHTEPGGKQKREASRRWKPGQSHGWSLCLSAGDLRGTEQRRQAPGPAHKSSLVLSRGQQTPWVRQAGPPWCPSSPFYGGRDIPCPNQYPGSEGENVLDTLDSNKPQLTGNLW